MSKEQEQPPLGPSLEPQDLPRKQECLAPTTTARAISTRPMARRAAPSAILFEEQDDLYWLRGDDLQRAKEPLGLRCDSASAGFDRITWSAYVADLAKKRIPIGLMRGNTISAVHLQAIQKPSQLRSIAVDLMPNQLVGQREIDTLASCLTRKHSRVGELVRGLRAQSAKGDRNTWTDPGVLYAYQVSDDIYEVDWDLTRISPPTVEALLLAAHLESQPLPCQLVPPKPRREKQAVRSVPIIQLSEPVTYGQLRLPL